MADLLDFAGVRVFDSNANPGAGYVARFYQSGTTTPVTVYTDESQGTAHGTFVAADASGVFPAVWSEGGAAVKCVIETSTGATVQTIDPVFSHASAASAASSISFTPTVDIPATNVQDAIEQAAASAASGFGAYGLGITGNAALLANIDATNIGAGAYRFDGTTTGTFPTGVAAADTGLIETWRQASGAAMMMLYHATTDRKFHRRMASSTWGAWREDVTVNQGASEGDTIYRAASAWTRLAKGTAGQALRMNAGATAPEWGDYGYSFQTAVATTSGTTVEISAAIPASAKEIVLHFRGVDCVSTGNLIVQLGDSGGYETTGYLSASSSGGADVDSVAGMIIRRANAAREVSGRMDFVLTGTNIWAQSHGARSGSLAAHGGGDKTLSGTLDRIRLTTDSGDTFEAGSVVIGWR